MACGRLQHLVYHRLIRLEGPLEMRIDSYMRPVKVGMEDVPILEGRGLHGKVRLGDEREDGILQCKPGHVHVHRPVDWLRARQ